MRPKAKRRAFEDQLFGMVLAASLPSFFLLIFCLWYLQLSFAAISLIVILLLGKIALIAYFCKQRFSYQLRTLSSLLEAIVNGDYSLRGRVLLAKPDSKYPFATDSLNELVVQINMLADTLMNQRMEVKESQLLLGKVINNIEIALLSVNEHGRITQVNFSFCKLFSSEPAALLAKTVDDLKIRPLLEVNPDQPIDWHFPSKSGRFSVYRDQYIEEGKPHYLLLIKDVKIMLRTEEQQAWQKLIRVLGHEINNSLTPISSLSESLQKIAGNPEKSEIVKQSLGVIHERASGLIKLVSSYKELARQPNPTFQKVDLCEVVENIRTLYPDSNIRVICHQSRLYVDADQDQIEQVLINLVKNAHESHVIAFETEDANQLPPIIISLGRQGEKVTICVLDEGTGISNPSNLFVPFYTTKTKGSGVGLAVSRQIIESHGGELLINNREEAKGCKAVVHLPLCASGNA